jgi:hypothetical protein
MIRERLAGMFRKGRKDKGSILLSTMLLILMLGSVGTAMSASTTRTIQNADASREFTESGQLADQGLQDAAFLLNNTPDGPFPTQTSPRTGTTERGTWSWYAQPVVDAPTGKTTTIVSTGDFQGVKKTFTIKAGAPRVGGFKRATDGQLSYELSPATAFGHVLLAPTVTVQNGIGSGAATTFLKGAIGVIGAGPVKTDTYPGLPSQKDVSYLLYGSGTGGLSLPNATRVPAGVFLDPKFVTENMARCGTVANNWTASQNGGILVANDNTACYASMTFDVPTVITGAGAFNAFVSGNVSFEADVKVPDGTALNIYTNGSTVDFWSERTTDTSLDVTNTFIYAPQADCRTQPFRSTLKALEFSGAIACGKSVAVAGKFTGKAPVKPLGADVYENNIWYLTDYQQASGTRG